MMTEGLFYDTLRQAILAAISMAMPILAAALVIGLVVGLFQALTSIQEMSLTFVPKLAGVLIVVWLTMGIMTQTLVAFFSGHVIPLIQGG
ncbi:MULTISPECIES: flagellar biosynthetic protein FliQ [unclassified Epibacterium]|jgi:flagellar biosynthetic protein FliQ|uniref:flagellar biosynthetic protein FliQ n=1 Tax=unclassified Epibacterium TaxID=2639179 RepID=UPI001EF703AE|nr:MULTISPECIES: flagellar biosynthetic protein FliQ [unclassified Epibacterium]MCG7623639.1 flagellar biosynthetic protein FliQ [Epibacterium sp. Ofav1-8]MCG7628170.1 flagellar biosynthetic protein FliQ [Epibacterium sp. MM17-32]